MACMGFPGDEDPSPEEHECPECGNILKIGRGYAECDECGFYHEEDPPEKDYSNYDGPTPYDHL